MPLWGQHLTAAAGSGSREGVEEKRSCGSGFPVAASFALLLVTSFRGVVFTLVL